MVLDAICRPGRRLKHHLKPLESDFSIGISFGGSGKVCILLFLDLNMGMMSHEVCTSLEDNQGGQYLSFTRYCLHNCDPFTPPPSWIMLGLRRDTQHTRTPAPPIPIAKPFSSVFQVFSLLTWNLHLMW